KRRGGGMSRHPSRGLLAIIAALVAPPVVSLLLLPLRGGTSATDLALVLVLVVVAVAALGHRVAGAVAAASAAVWLDFFFAVPDGRFTIPKAAAGRTAVLLLLVGLAVSQLAARARRLRLIAVTDADYLARVHTIAALTQSSRSADTVVGEVRRQL